MDRYADRLRWGMERLGIGQAELARRVTKLSGHSMAQQSINHLLRPATTGSKRTPDIAKVLGLNATWLASGSGPTLTESDHEPETLPVDERAFQYTLEVPEVDISRVTGENAMQNYNNLTTQWRIPGDVLLNYTGVDQKALRIVTMVGDSMTPTIKPWEKVLINLDDTSPSPAGIFALWDGRGISVRRVEHIPHSDPPRVRISSDNEAYSGYERMESEAYIHGRVIAAWTWHWF